MHEGVGRLDHPRIGGACALGRRSGSSRMCFLQLHSLLHGMSPFSCTTSTVCKVEKTDPNERLQESNMIPCFTPKVHSQVHPPLLPA